jgi:aspartate aminotransferase
LRIFFKNDLTSAIPIPAKYAGADAPSSGRMSVLADTLIGSEVLKIAGQVNAMISRGENVANFTVGDFADDFALPAPLLEAIVAHYRAGATNYPPSSGMPALRQSVAHFFSRELGLDYRPEEILIAGGARPLIYAFYRTTVDPGDGVLYPVPSWNNNHYTHLVGGLHYPLPTDADTNYMPTAEALAPFLPHVSVVFLTSPLNPTGTMISAAALEGICGAIVDENRRRAGRKPVLLFYDQIYWALTFGKTHVHPVALTPEIRPWCVYIDGASKAFAATGIRVGWAAAPADLCLAASNILGHVGAWAPKPEQLAVADFLARPDDVHRFLHQFKAKIESRLQKIYSAFQKMKADGLGVDCIEPQGGIYLSVRFNLRGRIAPNGQTLADDEDVRHYLLVEGKCAFVPFSAFGVQNGNGWFRLSVGGVSESQLQEALPRLESVIRALK